MQQQMSSLQMLVKNLQAALAARDLRAEEAEAAATEARQHRTHRLAEETARHLETQEALAAALQSPPPPVNQLQQVLSLQKQVQDLENRNVEREAHLNHLLEAAKRASSE